ncbi:unnamed protein product [Thelazia callipaeda]|uniref:Apple domain-containing protein n=1 Tax=Thelazia callipaeda TaxID=103827 RepID=A0A0N5CL56_THECL|nr:unnamed protein product [Thelazia callipaeda]
MLTYPNLQLTCATAYEKHTSLSEQQCRNLCLQKSIQTCQYQRIKSAEKFF